MTSIYPLLAEPDLDAHKGYILAEEDALKQHLTGISVPAIPAAVPPAQPKPAVPVGVWYRFPEGERQIKYPFITIDLMGAEPAYDLFQSDHWYNTEGLYRPSFSPTLPPPPPGWAVANWQVPNYLPMRLTFQVSHFARSNLHDRYLTSIFATDVFPPRPFFINCPADGVDKRIDVIGMAANNAPETTESGSKRIFRKFYTINMLTEIPQTRFEDGWTYKVLRTLIPVVERDNFESYFKTFLYNQPAPLTDFTQEEREQGGEFFHIWHQGSQPKSP